MKIAICSIANGKNYREIVKYGIKSKILYAQKHNYTFYDGKNILDETRPIAWSKIKHILKYLDNYDYIVWIDADTYIMNDTIKLEDIITELMEQKDIMIARDWKLFNTGVMFCKNSQWTKDFLNHIYEQKKFINHPNWEQASFIDCYEKNNLNSKDNVLVLPLFLQNKFNSYWFTYYPDDCFILHFPGCWRDNVNNGLDRTMNTYCPIKKENENEQSYQNRLHWLKHKARAEIDRMLKN